MLCIHTSAQAKKMARALEKALEEKGLPLAHGAALDTLARLSGFANWNAWSVALSPAAIDARLHDFELAHLQATGDETYGPEVALLAHTGFQLRYDALAPTCDYVRVCDPLGRETMYWHQDEWREDPAGVMGAILGALVRGTPVIPTVAEAPASAARDRAPARPTPTLSTLDFHQVHAVIFAGQCFNLEWREDAALAWLGRTEDPAYADWEDETALQLHREEDGLVWSEELTVGQLNELRWDSTRRCFTNPQGESFEFFVSKRFGDASD